MSLQQKLTLNIAAQLVLFVIVGISTFSVYQNSTLKIAVGVPLVALYAFQVLMLLKSVKALWWVLNRS